jgi:divalent metal cation (Fe/Co/Zn/Cd) transporter
VIAGTLLYALTAVVAASAVVALVHGTKAESSGAGIAVTAGALMIMPVLAKLKRSKGRELRNRALEADAVQSATCAYLAAVTLGSLAMNAAFGIAWLDTVAALFALPILIIEGRRAFQGEVCACC